MTPTRVVWISRHTPTPSQRLALASHFPAHELIVDARAFDSADQLIARYHAANGDEMVVVAPLAVIKAICARGLHPLYAEMRQVPCHSPSAEVRIRNRCYRFVGFSRIRRLHFDTEPVNAHVTTNATTKENAS